MQLLADSELQASKHCLNRQLKSGGMPGEPRSFYTPRHVRPSSILYTDADTTSACRYEI